MMFFSYFDCFPHVEQSLEHEEHDGGKSDEWPPPTAPASSCPQPHDVWLLSSLLITLNVWKPAYSSMAALKAKVMNVPIFASP
jgi:hypothetical protein